MRHLWIGLCLNDRLEQEILDHGGKLMSSKVSQDNLVAGLDALGIEMDSLNAYPFPLTAKKVPRESWSRTGRSTDVHAGYRNRKYINRLARRRALVREAHRWALAHRGEDVTVWVFAMHSPFLAAALEVKKQIPTARICLIVPDLPQYMDLGMNRIKKVLKAIDWRYIRRTLPHIDRYILYSRHMAEFLHLKDGTWCVMEGSINERDVLEEPVPHPADITAVMYSGVTDLRYGLPELLDAFALLDDPHYELWITGGGNAVPLIEERAAADPRIRYFGFLPSREELLRKQKSATMLINVRKPDEPASAYCFPSKLFEYMISGNPVLSFRIPGIPEEYFDYLIAMEDSTPATVAAAIKRVAAMSPEEREQYGERSKQFVLSQKNETRQAERMFRFVQGTTA